MTGHIALIGFGEAATTLVAHGRWEREVRAFDVKTLEAGTADAMRSAYRSHGIIEAGDTGSAVAGADVVLSLVTADQSLANAYECAVCLPAARQDAEGPRPVTGPKDIHAYLAEFEDIPGTRVFTAARARAGYHLNQFAMSLMKPENRERWKSDEAAYITDWPLSFEQKEAVLARDYNRLLDLGGNIYFLSKIFSTDGLSFVQAVSTMTGASIKDYQAMMNAGGRSPDGVRSKKDKR